MSAGTFYTIGQEWCGHPERRYVVREHGETFVSCHLTRDEAAERVVALGGRVVGEREDAAAMAAMRYHFANGPETWTVVKAAERCWHVRNGAGDTITVQPRKCDAVACLAESSYYVNAWQERTRWYRGEQQPHCRPWLGGTPEEEAG